MIHIISSFPQVTPHYHLLIQPQWKITIHKHGKSSKCIGASILLYLVGGFNTSEKY